jgi:hypothetical protein
MQPRYLGGAALQTSTYESKSGPFRAAWRRESDNAALKAPLFHGGTADRDIRATDVTCGFEVSRTAILRLTLFSNNFLPCAGLDSCVG